MDGKMKAVLKKGATEGAQLVEVDVPTIGARDVLIEVQATSICGTDVHIYNWDEWSKSRVKPPYVFGHEFSGIVKEVGEAVTRVEVGDYVSAETHLVCHTCPQCLTGNYHICKNTKIIGVDTNGCFAEYVALPEQNLWKNPKNMPVSIASIQEPMGNAVHTVLNGEVAGKSVAIIGCGPIGLMAVGVAKAAGASQVLAFDVNEYRLELASQMGATVPIHSGECDPVEEALILTDGHGVDVVCEMSGHPVAMDQGFKMVTNGGRVSILSLPTTRVDLDITNDIVFKGITVQGITGRKMYETWQQVSRLLQSEQVDVKPIITHHLPLEDYELGFKLMNEGKCGKVVLYPHGVPTTTSEEVER
ncbi:L-threonine 3-dehydrogenase [Pontibacillus halophilus JSM 076056 = DSM 19796]|uniref:L-threonine 3-dehydrogenase n=1 Tax=Pontibacillus halophilus JSM 076056 = DSM 19796 TaxID=1385510 RepID=A0A0A5GPD2_9BACI|nr:L-threonine 3-dehydrogenase [Pontibacillus halophilus]KGX93098.1 L-threonine 3-dehydrogenase [Pontibacillus halophilus JSM 076056 = DSM 19796]